RRPLLLRPGAPGASDAAGRARQARRALHRVQVRGEHRPDGSHPRAGRNVCRFHQALERRMNTFVKLPETRKKPQVQKEDAMWLQKELINKNYHELAAARANNRKVSATFVLGNLNELLMCFDFARSLPETNAL